VQQIKNEKLPTNHEEIEDFFVKHLKEGERLFTLGNAYLLMLRNQ
jgi:hypothetical protein